MARHTTCSLDFVGLTRHANTPQGSHPHGQLWQESDYGDEIIIAVFDSWISSERMSFNDDGMGPIPNTWKGKCQIGNIYGILLSNEALVTIYDIHIKINC